VIKSKNELALSVRSLGRAYSKGMGGGLGLLTKRGEPNRFWALQDVSFDVPKGVGLGIIGGNGSGKSTLLKILARIVLPTVGEVEVHGKVNSLLEVGTGFQPNLSGRENIYLNGSILGMSRKEIDLVFDEIVNFSGIGEFIDMPVKRYSSGMYSRLAFSVAANVTGDILLIDEVLAVGDAQFRKKCLGRMEGLLTSEHRTVLFVSHSMESVVRFCSKAIWLDHGKIRHFGDAEDVVAEYLGKTNRLNTKYVNKGNAPVANYPETKAVSLLKQKESRPTLVSKEEGAGFIAAATITSIEVTSNSDCRKALFRSDEEISAIINCEIASGAYPICPVVHLNCMPRAGVPEETHVFTCVGDPLPQIAGNYTQIVKIPKDLLTVGQYFISVALVTKSKPLIRHCKLERAVTFQIIAPKNEGETFLLEQLHGVIQPRLKWRLIS